MKQQKMVVISSGTVRRVVNCNPNGKTLGLDSITIPRENSAPEDLGDELLWELPLKEYFTQGWTVASFKVMDGNDIVVLLEKEQ